MNEFRAIRRGAEVGFGSAMEAALGFSRALRVGDLIFVSGMTATDLSGKVVAEGMYEQMKMIYQLRIIGLLNERPHLRSRPGAIFIQLLGVFHHLIEVRLNSYALEGLLIRPVYGNVYLIHV